MNRGGKMQKKKAKYTGIEFPRGMGLKIAGTHVSEDYCNEGP